MVQVEIWSDLQCAGGARLGVIPDIASVDTVHRTTGDDILSLALPPRSPAISHLRTRRVIRIVDGADWSEWRVLRVRMSRDGGVSLSRVECVNVLADLGRAVLERIEADGKAAIDFEAIQLSPVQHLQAFILPSLLQTGLTWISLGTISPTDPIDMVYSRSSALEAIKQISSLSNSEFTLRRNGTTSYLIDIIPQLGSAAPEKRISLGKNLIGVDWEENADQQTTRIYGTGTEEDSIHSTIAGARWKIIAKSGNNITLADPTDGAGPIGFDDQLNNLYIRTDTGTVTRIIDSTSATQVINVSSGSAFTVGDFVTVHPTSGGADLTFLRHPAAEFTYGIYPSILDRTDLPGTVNLLRNPALTAWASSLPTDWSKLGDATIQAVTDPTRWQHGGRSARVMTSSDGDGLETATTPILPSANRPYFTGGISFYLVSGRVRVELVASDGTQSWVLPDGTNGKASSTQTQVWNELTVAGLDLHELGATTCRLRIVQEGVGPVEFYVDTAQITQSAGQEPFVDGAGPNKLWHAINARLALYAVPQVQVRVTALDLERLKPSLYAHEELVIGGKVRVTDTTLGIDFQTRITELERDVLRRKPTTLSLSNRPEDLVDIVIKSRQPGRHIRIGDTERTLTVQATFTYPPASPATAHVRLAARPENAGIRYVILSEDESIPIIGGAAWMQYTQPLQVDQLTGTDLIVAAYAELGAAASAVETWRVAKSIRPQVALSLTEPSAGKLSMAWSQSGDVTQVAIYRKVGGWPTINGTNTGTLDPTYFLGQWAVTPDGGGRLSNGSLDIGRTAISECEVGCDFTHAYAPSDIAHVIAVPIDTASRPGPRAVASITMQGVPSPTLLSFAATKSSDGTACDNPAAIDVAWIANGAVSDGTHALRLYKSVDGAPRTLIDTIINPTSVNTHTNQLSQYVDPTKPAVEHIYSWELRSGASVIASGSSAPIQLPLSTECMGAATVTVMLDRTKKSAGPDKWWQVQASAPYTNAPTGAAVRFYRSDNGTSWTPLSAWLSLSVGNGSRQQSFSEWTGGVTIYVKADIRASASDSAQLLTTHTSSITLPAL